MYISETWGNMADLWFFLCPQVLLENHVNVKVSWLNIMKIIFVVLLWVPCKGCGSGSNRGEPLFFSLHGVGTDNRVTPPEYCFICNWQKFQLHGTSPKLWPRHHRIFEVCNCVVTLFLAVICSSEVTTFSQEGKSVFQSQSEKKFSWKGCWFKRKSEREAACHLPVFGNAFICDAQDSAFARHRARLAMVRRTTETPFWEIIASLINKLVAGLSGHWDVLNVETNCKYFMKFIL